MNANELTEKILERWNWGNPDISFTTLTMNIRARWVDGTDEDPPELTIIGLADHATDLRNLAYETITSWVSEATNNDACVVEVREQSAHFDDGNLDAAPMGTYVLVTARVHDWLT